MNCNRCHSNLISFLDGSLKGKDFHDIEDHLKECASCSGFAVYLKETLSTIKDTKIKVHDPFFYTRIKARLNKHEGPLIVKSGFARILQPAFFTLLLMMAIFAGVEIGRLDPSDRLAKSTMEELDPWFNEMGAEPIETFLID